MSDVPKVIQNCHHHRAFPNCEICNPSVPKVSTDTAGETSGAMLAKRMLQSWGGLAEKRVKELEAALTTAEAERDALREYAQHKENCDSHNFQDDSWKNMPCDCGLVELPGCRDERYTRRPND